MPLLQRRAADRDYLRRTVPRELAAGSRAWLVALCEAELGWAAHDWRLLNPDADDGRGWSWGTPPAEIDRLPHEHVAALILNLNGKRAATERTLEATNPADTGYVARLERELAQIGRQLARATAQYHTLRAVVDWRAGSPVREAA